MSTVITENGITRDASGKVLDSYALHCRWAIGPLGTREQWESDQKLLHSDFGSWRKLHGV